MLNSLSGKTVLVSGAAGFLGAHVTRALLDAGAHVRALTHPATNLRRLSSIRSRIEICQQPIPSDYVFHLAASGVQPGAPRTRILENISLTLDLLEAADRFQPIRFVSAGSCFEYPDGHLLSEDTPVAPRSLYGATKAASAMLVHSYRARLHVSTLRLFTMYGPEEEPHRLIPSAISAALEGKPAQFTAGGQLRDFVYVEDAAEAFLAAALAECPSGEVINVSTGHPARIRDVVEQIYRQCESAGLPAFGDLPYGPGEYMSLSGDPSKAARILNWRAMTSLEDGIALTLDWRDIRTLDFAGRGTTSSSAAAPAF